MNINSAIPMTMKPYMPAPDRAPQTTKLAVSDVLTDQQKKEALAKEFYTKEEEPWNKISHNYMQNGVLVSMQHYAKEIYLLSM
ncbi:hypothetical protein, partial [Pseudomonas viridiflava]